MNHKIEGGSTRRNGFRPGLAAPGFDNSSKPPWHSVEEGVNGSLDMQNESDALKRKANWSAPEPPVGGSSCSPDPAVNPTDIPEQLERLKRLAADPNYPSTEIIKSIAEKMLDLFQSE